MPDGNLSMLDVNPFGYQAVLGSDEHRSRSVMPVAATNEGPMVS
jgi:hypothetical protein